MIVAAKEFGDLRIAGKEKLEADIIVIGSGAGGATVAATAAELGYSVIVLEEGPYVPAANAPARLSGSLAQLWRNGGLTAAYGAPPVSYAEGRCVGGSTEINTGIFQRAPERLLAEWAVQYRIDKFSPEYLAPYYDWAARIVNASPTSGPKGPPTDILSRAGQLMGWQVTDLERGQRNCVGTNMCALTCPTGAKQSMSATLLPRASDKNARIISDIKVRKIIMQGGRAKGIEAVARAIDGRTYWLTAHAKKIFVCAGAIHTPSLLQSAGFRAAGRTLRLHPILKCLAFFNEVIDAPNFRVSLAAITEFMPNLRMGGSIFTPGTYGLALADDWKIRSPHIKEMRHAMIYYVMVRGHGCGRIRAMPGGAAPLVTYRHSGEDWRRLSKGVGRLGQALLRTGATHVFPSIGNHPGWTYEAETEPYIDRPRKLRGAKLISIHLFGSCPLGTDESICVADSFGRVHNAENLYIADASIIPEAPGVNPQATVMALARRNALHILETSK